MAQWDSSELKTQLRRTAQKLGQMQDRLEADAQVAQRDTATLLQQGHAVLARAKAQKLIRDDVWSNLLQTLEMHVGVILGHLHELERREPPSPVMTEAAASIIYAAVFIESKDLHIVREFLMQALGPDFTHAAMHNRDAYVSQRIVRALSTPPPSAVQLDYYLFGIARTHNIRWFPDLSAEQKVNALSEQLDLKLAPAVDMTRLRSLCSHGLPSHPPWLRARVWRLFYGTLPLDKSAWRAEARKQRDNYYDLVRRLLDPIGSLADPTEPLESIDAALIDVSNELATVPPSLLITLDEGRGSEPSPQCPLDESAPEDIRIACAGNIDDRLHRIRSAESEEDDGSSSDDTPEIRLEETPEIRLDDADSPKETRQQMKRTNSKKGALPASPTTPMTGRSTTLLASHSYANTATRHHHSSALLRLLYIHSCLNPANHYPHIASLLVPVYATLVEEVDPEDSPHVEADTFWLFEAIIAEFADLEDESNGTVWVKKLSERLQWADSELAEDMQVKGLDPGLPHYSFRWLIPLLTHTLPLPAVLMVWDALFSRPPRERETNHRLDYLIDVCASMLLCAKAILLQLGRKHRKVHNLWSDEIAAIPSSEFGPRELEEAFIEGMAFLQGYPLGSVGGIEKVLQTAYDLATQRATESASSPDSQGGFGSRLRDTVWKGFRGNLESHPEYEESEEESEVEEATTPSAASGSKLTSLASTVWRGWGSQNQSVPSSPLPSAPVSPPSKELPPSPGPSATERARSMLWGYSEKLKESDTAATLAKVSTNWRVKALDVWSNRKTNPEPASTSTLAPSNDPAANNYEHGRSISLTALSPFRKQTEDSQKRGSMPAMDRSDVYSPPPRPVFRPVRDSIMFTGVPFTTSPTHSREASPVSDTGSPAGQSIRGSRTLIPAPESIGYRKSSGPRPLLLNSSTLMTTTIPVASPVSPARSDTQWTDAVRSQRMSVDYKRDSLSSVSSGPSSASDARFGRRVQSRSDWDSDFTPGGSRVVPLNRKTRSPMAQNRASSPASSTSTVPPSSHRRVATDIPRSAGAVPVQDEITRSPSGWGRVDLPDSPRTIPSPPLPSTPDAFNTTVRVQAPESQRVRGSVVIPDANDTTYALATPENKPLARRSATMSRALQRDENSDSSATEPPPRNPKLRSKRFPSRLQTVPRSPRTMTAEAGTLLGGVQLTDAPVDLESVRTPRAESFDTDMAAATLPPPSPRARRARKVSGEGETRARKGSAAGEGRTRKISGETRMRKVSGERPGSHYKRESAAVEGDDEGYNDLLSAYESEDTVA